MQAAMKRQILKCFMPIGATNYINQFIKMVDRNCIQWHRHPKNQLDKGELAATNNHIGPTNSIGAHR
tara:strand:- start:1401 stop:1601 length:201 start_codon:yes stop_codon:yes gene_type:complete